MLFDIFSRLFLALTSVGTPSGPNIGNGTVPYLPSNYSLAHYFDNWINNETVILDNPNFQYENGEIGENENNWMIILPLCSGFIDSEGVVLGVKNGSVVPDEKMGYWYPAPHLFPSENRSHYMFTVRKPSCSLPLKTIRLQMDEFEVVGDHGRFLRNGYYGYNNVEFYSPQEYCISTLKMDFVEVQLCESQEENCSLNPTDNSKRPCIQKCCNPDEIYSFARRACIKSSTGSLFRPTFYHHLSSKLSPDEQERSTLPHYHIKFPRYFKYFCQENRTQIFPAGHNFAEYLSNFTQRKYHSAQFKIRTDGKIMYRKDGKAIVMPDQDRPIYLQEQNKKCYTLKQTAFYCIDGAAEYGNPDPFSNDEGEMFLVTCSEYLFEPPKIGPLSFVYGNVMITSSIFSLLTVVVYGILKEKQNIHGWTIASYALSIFFMYIFLGLAHLIRYYRSDEVLKTASCVAVGIASHLFSLASFMWLFLINWDIWWTFRNIRPTRTTTNQHQRVKDIRHFLLYCVVGWGIPIIIMAVTTYLHFKYEDAAENNCAIVNAPLPAYGRESCEIKQLSLGVYLYFPATFLLGCNLLFFIITMHTLCRHSLQTQLATRSLERHRQSFQLFAKLFFVMGVTRVFEVITWAGSGPTLTWYWAVFDIFNILQAVAIFIVYVCKRDVLIALRNLFLQYFYGSDQNRRRRSISRHERNSQCQSKTSTLNSRKSTQSVFASMIDVSNITTAPLMIKPVQSGSDERLIICSVDVHEHKCISSG